jgi:general secretion pathway protein L
MQGRGKDDPTLFLQAASHSLNMALWANGRVVFMRYLAYPEQVCIESFDTQQQEFTALDQDAVKKCILKSCETIKTSLYYFQQDSSAGGSQADVAVLSGGIARENEWRELVGRELGLDVVVSSLPQEIAGTGFSGAVAEHWNPELFDSAFALALSGLKKLKNAEALNFLQGEFSSASWLFLSKRSFMAAAAVVLLACTAAIGYLWTDYRTLYSRSSSLRQQMNDVFTTTFPEVTRIVDPLVQMQSKLREVQTSEVSLPLFSGEKRVLEILADISARIPEKVSIHVSRLVIDKESVQIKGTTDAYNNVDVIKNMLAASSRYVAVKIVSATADKKKGKIRFEIRLQLGEAS